MDDGRAIFVIGAGAAGLAASISAARYGAKVVLLEKNSRIGGTVAHCLIHTIGGVYDSEGEFINPGLSIELAGRLLHANSQTHKRKIGRTWTLSVSPDVYLGTIESWIKEESNIEVMCNSVITSIETEEDMVCRISIAIKQNTLTGKPAALIDTTGSAEIIRMIEPDLVFDNPRSAAGGLIFQMRGVKPGALKLPNSINLMRAMRRAARDGLIPQECAMAWIDTGLYEDEAYVKLFVPLTANWRKPEVLAEKTHEAILMRDELVNFLVTLSGFSEAWVTRTGKLGIREGGMVQGEYYLTEADILSGRKFSDAACHCCWPIEYWDPETGVTLKELPHGRSYDIPLRSLKVRNLKNVWTAGKCLSATPLAQASARITGCCWAMGEAVGKAAVDYLAEV